MGKIIKKGTITWLVIVNDETKGVDMFEKWIVGSGSEGNEQIIEYLMFNGHVIDSMSRIYWSLFAITLIVTLSFLRRNEIC
jgi:hypothetical protein